MWLSRGDLFGLLVISTGGGGWRASINYFLGMQYNFMKDLNQGLDTVLSLQLESKRGISKKDKGHIICISKIYYILAEILNHLM